MLDIITVFGQFRDPLAPFFFPLIYSVLQQCIKRGALGSTTAHWQQLTTPKSDLRFTFWTSNLRQLCGHGRAPTALGAAPMQDEGAQVTATQTQQLGQRQDSLHSDAHSQCPALTFLSQSEREDQTGKPPAPSARGPNREIKQIYIINHHA